MKIIALWETKERGGKDKKKKEKEKKGKERAATPGVDGLV
jgi:hypothetical protein